MARVKKVKFEEIEKLVLDLERKLELFESTYAGEGINPRAKFEDVLNSKNGRRFVEMNDKLDGFSGRLLKILSQSHQKLRYDMFRDFTSDDATFESFLRFMDHRNRTLGSPKYQEDFSKNQHEDSNLNVNSDVKLNESSDSTGDEHAVV